MLLVRFIFEGDDPLVVVAAVAADIDPAAVADAVAVADFLALLFLGLVDFEVLIF